MKTIKLKKRSTYDDREILKAVVGTSPTNGVTIDQMRRFVKMLDSLDTESDELSLDNEDWQLLCQKFDAFPFAIVHRDIVDLRDEIENAGP